jgi:chromosome segregation ATPase
MTIETIITIIGVLAAPAAWIFGGRQAKKVEIKKSSTDALGSMQTVYDQFLADYKDRMAEVMSELVEVKSHAKELQIQFNKIQLDYATEVERSQNWEKLHRELMQKYTLLEKDYDELKGLYSKLKADFEKHKKAQQ